MQAKGYKDNCHMLTLSAPIDDATRANCAWFSKKWEETYKEYGAQHKHTNLYFAGVTNRGPAGQGFWSMHLLFQEPPKDQAWLIDRWAVATGGSAVMKHHHNTLRYWIKNYFEPDTEVTWGTVQMGPRALAKRDSRASSK